MRDAKLKIKIHRQGLADRAKLNQLINQNPLFNQVKRVIEIKISFQEQQVFVCFCFFNETNLHADGQVDPGSEGSADSARRQAEVFEELGEGLRQGQAGALLGDHHAAPHARQIHTPRLDTHTHGSQCHRWVFILLLPQLLLPRSTLAALSKLREDSDLQHLRLGAQAFGAQLHDGVGAEGVSDLVLTERAQPHRK